MATGRLPALRQMTPPPPCTCKQHQVDSGLEGKEDEEQGGGQMKLGRREPPRELEEGIGVDTVKIHYMCRKFSQNK